MKTIKDLETGTVVHGINGYSMVKVCVHGNKHYACLTDEIADLVIHDCCDVVDVIDDDDDSLECGC